MMDSALANGATTGDLVLMQPQGSQPQHLFDLSHGHPTGMLIHMARNPQSMKR